MPRLWTDTIEEHRREVRDAVLDATAALVADGGLLSVTMSRIAQETGIGRATLYKYFPDVEAILVAWHERQVTSHLARLADVRDKQDEPYQRLRAVFKAYALIRQKANGHHGSEIATTLHTSDHVIGAERHLHDLVRTLLDDAVATGAIRDDVPTDELASYCLHALSSGTDLGSNAALERLVTVTLGGLHPPIEVVRSS